MINKYNDHVIDFSVWKQSIVYLKGNKLKNRTLFIDSKQVVSQTADFHIHNDLLLVSTWEPSTYLFNLNSSENILALEGYSCSPRTLTHDGFSLSKKVKNSREKYYYNFEEQEITQRKDTESYLFQNQSLKIKKISEYEMKAETNKWHYKSQNPNSIDDVIGVYDDRLFLTLSNAELVALDKNSGRKLWARNPSIEQRSNGTIQDTQTFSLRLDVQQGKLIHPLITVDKNGNVKQNNYLNELESSHRDSWQIKGNAQFDFNQHYLVFSATRKTHDSLNSEMLYECFILVVDRLEDKIIFQILLNGGKDYRELRKVNLSEDIVYILDHGGELNVLALKSKTT